MSDLYKHIEQLGILHGYKDMTALCRAAGVSRSVMSELNNGRTLSLSKRNAEKFSELLSLSLDEIYGNEKTPATEADDERSIFLSSLMKKLGQLDLSDLDHFDVQADEILKRRQDVKE